MPQGQGLCLQLPDRSQLEHTHKAKGRVFASETPGTQNPCFLLLLLMRGRGGYWDTPARGKGKRETVFLLEEVFLEGSMVIGGS